MAESPGPKGHVQHMSSIPACPILLRVLGRHQSGLLCMVGSGQQVWLPASAPGTCCRCSNRCTGREAHHRQRVCVSVCLDVHVCRSTCACRYRSSSGLSLRESSAAGRVLCQWLRTVSRDCSPKGQSFKGPPPWSLQSPECCLGTSSGSISGITELAAETFGHTPDLPEHLHTLPETGVPLSGRRKASPVPPT